MTHRPQANSTGSVNHWVHDCERHRGRILFGAFSHWCAEWDFLPVDETTPEFDACLCFPPDIKAAAVKRLEQ